MRSDEQHVLCPCDFTFLDGVVLCGDARGSGLYGTMVGQRVSDADLGGEAESGVDVLPQRSTPSLVVRSASQGSEGGV